VSGGVPRGEAVRRAAPALADLEKDVALIEKARDAADELLAKDPAAAAAHLERWLGGREEFFKA
jgi:ATP-dependent DNA helicase RecG